MAKKHAMIVLLFILSLSFIVIGCSQTKENSITPPANASDNAKTDDASSDNKTDTSSNKPAKEKPEEAPDPVTITLWTPSWYNEDVFRALIKEPAEKKYPHITVNLVKQSPTTQLNQLIVAGQTPDIVYTTPFSLPDVINLELDMNLESLIKQYNFDLSRIDPNGIEAIKIMSGKDYLIGLPATLSQNFALYYNKDIFDKMGVDFPKDGMTWEEVIDLAHQVTRVIDGVQYRGLEPNILSHAANQLSLPYIDSKTNKAAVIRKNGRN